MRSFTAGTGTWGRWVFAVGAWLGACAMPAAADLDPNASQRFPHGGYAVVICGNTAVLGSDELQQWVREFLRQSHVTLTDNLGFQVDRIWMLIEDGEVDPNDDWTRGLFDPLPADRTHIAQSFQTIGELMWNDANTPRQLLILIAGHGIYSLSPLYRMRIELTDHDLIADVDFIDQCLDQINANAHGACPIERLDVISTICSSGGLIDDFRTYFHGARGSTWPEADHFTILTAGDWKDTTTALFGIRMLDRLKHSGAGVHDVNGDGVLSIYDYYEDAAKHDVSNPDVATEPNYVPWLPETIYVPGESFWPALGYGEHPLYYEWNGTPRAYLDLEVIGPAYGAVTLQPLSDHPDQPYQYPAGEPVVLTAVPSGGHFVHWKIYDPNHPDTPDITTINPLTISLDEDMKVLAEFACGAGVAPMLPPMLAALGLAFWIARRR